MPLRDYSFLSSLFLSRLGDQILLFLVPLVIFQITGSVSLSGYAFFIEALPRYVAFPLCGALCDYRSPYKLLRASQIARSAACFLGIAGYMMIDGVGWLITLSAITGVLTTQGLMSREVILTQAFKTQRFEKVLSYTQIADQLGMVLGPLVAAFLLTVWDWQIIVIGVAVLFIAADLCMSVWWRVTRPEMTPPAKLETNWFSPLVEAGKHIWHLPALKAVILLAAAVNLIIGVTLATAPAMVTGLQGQTEFYYGVLQAAGAIATVVILFAIAHVVLPLNFLGFWGYLAICIGGFLTSAGQIPVVYAIGFVVVIGFDKMFNIFLRSMRRRIIPAKDFGKTTGLIVLLNNMSQPFAGLLVGVFASSGDARTVVFVLSATMLVVGLGALVFGRQSFRYLAMQKSD